MKPSTWTIVSMKYDIEGKHLNERYQYATDDLNYGTFVPVYHQLPFFISMRIQARPAVTITIVSPRVS